MKKFWIIGGAVAVTGMLIACGSASPSTPVIEVNPIVSVSASTPEPVKPTSNLTGEQRNAVKAAQDYLEYQGFSRAGLIDQLSSDFGDGYTKADATKAVDSLRVDWNAQAVRVAKSYLSTQSFSRKGLLQQLESSAGEKFTHAQAVYGVEHSGL